MVARTRERTIKPGRGAFLAIVMIIIIINHRFFRLKGV